MPTLIVHGDKDTEVPIAQSIKTSQLMPDCRLVKIHSADHWFAEPGKKEEMLEAIERFLADAVQKIS